ncbi:serine/threonine protein kinase [Rhodococcus oxybenzonivorans]|nr:serine/threonine protein kinase [Rhodococcus oxybenzonivorans]
MVVLGSLTLCVTASIAAVQIGQRTDPGRQPRPQPASPSGGGPPGWMWVLLGVLTVAVLGLVGYITIGPRLAEEARDADRPANPTESSILAPPATLNPALPVREPVEALPSTARPCPPVFNNPEFTSSAVGTAVTSRGFAEEVRRQYLSQLQRGRPVTIVADSPVTGQRYSMFCGGMRVVTCTGGNNAVVYVY